MEKISPATRLKVLEQLASLPYPSSHKPPFTEVPFGDVFDVWAEFALQEMKKKAGKDFSILGSKAAQLLKDKLAKEMSFRCAPTMAALLHLAKLEKRLHGDSPKGNYLYFIEKILPDPKYQKEMFFHFPPLARTLADTILLWIEQAVELLSRITCDLKSIEETFSLGKKLGKVADLTGSLSDLHFGNRSVYRIEFENGLQLIYKPKPLALDAAYNRFLEKLKLGLKTYKILDQGEYGWVEFIETLPCDTEEELKLYFERLGMLISLMFILEGTDCHYENVLASGDQPVLIDLESLFHPTVKQTKSLPELTVWNHSVFRTGFLPSFGLAAQRRMDISPLSAEEDQEIPRLIAQWQEVNTDKMQFAFIKKNIHISVPRPRYKGKIVSVTSFIPDLLKGFERMYRRFMDHQSEVLGWLEDLFQHPVRCIFRPTELYFQILQRLTDPKLMQSEAETNKTLDILTRFSTVKESPYLKAIAEKEKASLLQGDIPFFLSSPSDTALYLGKEKVAPHFFESPAKEQVIKKIQALDEADLQLQLQYIDHSLYYLKMTDGPKNYKYVPYDPNKAGPILSDKEILSFADRIGEKILSLAQPLSDGSLAWISLELDPKINRFIFQPISTNFYSGTCGIAFFLGILGKILQKPRYSEVSEELLSQLIRPYREEKDAMRILLFIGGMSGAGGAVYAFSSLSKLLNRPEYLKDALEIIPLIEKKKIDEDNALDIISGSAGFILTMLSLYKLAPEKSVLDLAIHAGDHLLKKGKLIGAGMAWETMEDKYLCGFSHGAAGIAYALLKLYESTREKKYLNAAEKGFAYESGFYSLNEKNWPDFRVGEEAFTNCSWCHGSPGITLSRLYALPTVQCTEDIEHGVDSIIHHLIANLDHLCCGNFGRTTVLWDAGKILKRDDLKEIAQKQTALYLKRFDERGNFRLYYDLADNIQSPGFMQGLSGIGYELLRQTKSGEHLPEVLVFE